MEPPSRPAPAELPAAKPDPHRWVDEHGDCLYRYALVRVRTPEVAEDLVQETLLVAVRSQDKFAGRSSQRSWLVGILKNKIDRLTKKIVKFECHSPLPRHNPPPFAIHGAQLAPPYTPAHSPSF